MANVALDAFIGFGQTVFENDGKTWVALTLNKTGRNDGKYDFNGESFDFKGSLFAGVTDGDNTWLLCTLDPNMSQKGGIFEFKVWKQGENGAKGSFDKQAGDALAVKWHEDGCYSAILVNDIPNLKVLASLLAEYKIIAKSPSGEMKARLVMTPEQVTELTASCATMLMESVENGMPAPKTPGYLAASDCHAAGIMCLALQSDADVPVKELKDMFGNVTESVKICFPYSGTLPSYDELLVKLPSKEVKAGNSGKGNYTPKETTKEVLEARKQFYYSMIQLAYPEIKDGSDVLNELMKHKSIFKDYSDTILGIMGR